MFDALKEFLAELAGRGGNSREFGAGDQRLAAAALLAHVGDADGEFSPVEREQVQKLVADRFGLDPAAAARLVRQALASDHEEVGVDYFVNVLNRALEDDGKLKIVAMMWDVVYADGTATETEESIVWRIAAMLGVSEHDLETLRRTRAPDDRPERAGKDGDG